MKTNSSERINPSETKEQILALIEKMRALENKGLDAYKILKNNRLSDIRRKYESEKELQRKITNRELDALLKAHETEEGKNILKGLRLRRDSQGEIFSEKETRILMDTGLAGKTFDTVPIREIQQGRDLSVYAPIEFLFKCVMGTGIVLGKGLFGIRRNILESRTEHPTNPQQGISTLHITTGVRDLSNYVSVAMTTSAALESWKNANPDKKIIALPDTIHGGDLPILWEKTNQPQAKTFHYEKYHFPLKQTNRKNLWPFLPYIGAVFQSPLFFVRRIFGKNEFISATKPLVLPSGEKHVTLSFGTGFRKSTVYNSAYSTNEVLKKWIQENPHAHIKNLDVWDDPVNFVDSSWDTVSLLSLLDDNPGFVPPAPSRHLKTISIVYTDSSKTAPDSIKEKDSSLSRQI